MTDNPRELDPTSVAVHYKTAADFWENQAKVLRHLLDKERARVVELEQQGAATNGD